MTQNKRFTFSPLKAADKQLIHKWLREPHAAEWFYGQGLENTLKGIDDFIAGKRSADYWLGYDNLHPIAFFITSNVLKPDDELSGWCSKEGNAITLDVLIGEIHSIGKGLSRPLIIEFLLTNFPDTDQVLIDPESANTRAIHVYKKAGFLPLGEFVPSYSHRTHLMMRLDMGPLRLSAS